MTHSVWSGSHWTVGRRVSSQEHSTQPAEPGWQRIEGGAEVPNMPGGDSLQSEPGCSEADKGRGRPTSELPAPESGFSAGESMAVLWDGQPPEGPRQGHSCPWKPPWELSAAPAAPKRGWVAVQWRRGCRLETRVAAEAGLPFTDICPGEPSRMWDAEGTWQEAALCLWTSGEASSRLMGWQTVHRPYGGSPGGWRRMVRPAHWATS